MTSAWVFAAMLTPVITQSPKIVCNISGDAVRKLRIFPKKFTAKCTPCIRAHFAALKALRAFSCPVVCAFRG